MRARCSIEVTVSAPTGIVIIEAHARPKSTAIVIPIEKLYITLKA